MNKFAIFLINLYSKYVSRFLHTNCKFMPVCSDYGRMCFEKYGFFKATCKVIYRLLRCNPFSKGGLDLPCIIFALAFATSAQVYAIQDTKTNEVLYITVNKINSRSGPGEQYSLISTFKSKGYPVVVLKTLNNWSKVTFFNGETGWVKSNYIKNNKSTILIVTKKSKIYSRNDSSSNVLAIIGVNQPVVKVDICDNWIKIKIKFSGKEVTGWIKKGNVWGNV